MQDDIFLGILSGLFGPVVARILSRYRYRFVFALGFLSLYVFVFVGLVVDMGWQAGWERFISGIFSATMILVALGAGLMAMFCVFVSSIGSKGGL
ncbi:hypothetical protein UC34_22345 [Pandoraea vervacti]|uniref:Major facilitator superfamily (MFS) profile domain-containing protein n=1 Tax=Pandoraea vervacti TaxID=656178 RepID=A0ABM5T2B3_9BURK|nr:hypothetical protein UC34_22345 [Pandoraea vervacti]